MIFYRSINVSMEEDDGFDVNTPGAGEYIFAQTSEGNVETCDDVIVISDDDDDDNVDLDGDDSDDDDDGFDANAPGAGDLETYEDYMRRRPIIGSSTQNLGPFANLFTTSLMAISTATAAAAATTTTTTTTMLTTTEPSTTSPTMVQTIASTTAESLHQCCICLQNIDSGGINMHNNIHHIHISCLVCLLNANNQIIWWGNSFGFHCPLCRKPVYGTVMLVS